MHVHVDVNIDDDDDEPEIGVITGSNALFDALGKPLDLFGLAQIRVIYPLVLQVGIQAGTLSFRHADS